MAGIRTRALAPLCCLGLIWGSGAQSETPTPRGGQFQVNTDTRYNRYPAVDAAPDGRFVVAWSGYTDPPPYPRGVIRARRFDQDSNPVGADFRVDTSSGYYLHADYPQPDVAMDLSGGFVVVWSVFTGGYPLGGVDVIGRRFGADGIPLAEPFIVNSFIPGSQINPQVDIGPDGNFIVVWEDGSNNGDGDGDAIRAQRYAANGSAIGVEFTVNSYTLDDQRRPAVAVGSDGEFVVAWHAEPTSEPGSDQDSRSIRAQRFTSDGELLGSSFQVNTESADDQENPSISIGPDGDFVIVWDSEAYTLTDDSPESSWGQRYDANGVPIGGEFQINTTTLYAQSNPKVASGEGGDFMVVWQSDVPTPAGDDDSPIAGQLFSQDGQATGAEYQVNTFTTGSNILGDITMKAGGQFVVVWFNFQQSSIQGQRFTVPLIFSNGFESGDTTSWSATLP